MKKTFIILAWVLLVAGGAAYVFREQLWDVVVQIVTSDTFISADTDAFDPGLPVGSIFPDIRALSKGEEIVDVSGFAHNKGLVFIANRSADW